MQRTYEDVHQRLDEMAGRFPAPFYAELSGGILLLPDTVEEEDGLITLGCYCTDALGCRIELYYGSFCALAEDEDWTEELWEQELWTTLAHEFTHHIEGLAGADDLDRQDALDYAQYQAELAEENAQNEAPKPQKKRKWFWQRGK